MPECVNYSNCQYFIENMKNSPTTSAMVQKNYCLNRYEECARFQVFEKLGANMVPADLSPSEGERVEQILKGR